MKTVLLTCSVIPQPLLEGVVQFADESTEIFVLGSSQKKSRLGCYWDSQKLEPLEHADLNANLITSGEQVSEEWLSLLERDALRYGLELPARDSINSWGQDAEVFAASFFKGKGSLMLVDECVIYGLLYAQVRYLAYCTEDILTLIEDDRSRAALLVYALRHATVVVAETDVVVIALKAISIPARLVTDIKWDEVAVTLKSYKKTALTAFDSLKQKRCEITYEAQYGDIYDSKYHDAICYQLMDEYLVDIIDDAIATKITNNRTIRILDLGCGPGSMVPHLQRHDYWEYHGVDISQTMVDLAKHNYPDLHFQVGDAENLDYPDEYFDVVLCSGMLHHFPNLENVIVEVKRVLKTDGCMVSREPNEDNFASLNPALGFLHICLKNLIHLASGTSSIVEPEEHDYHTDFDFVSMPEVFAKYLWVDGFYTNQKISYFYDMICDREYKELINKMEEYLDGQPGLNIVAVARKTERIGISLSVKEKIKLLKYPALVRLRSHILTVLEMYDRLVSGVEISRLCNTIKYSEPYEAFKITRSALIYQSSLGPDLAMPAYLKDYDRFEMSVQPTFDELSQYHYLRIICSEDVDARLLVEQAKRCLDYGLIEFVFHPEVSILNVGSDEFVYLAGLSPLPIVSLNHESSDKRTGFKRYFLSRNLLTRKNFVEALENVLTEHSLFDYELTTWLKTVSESVVGEFKISFQTGEFYEFLISFERNGFEGAGSYE